MEVEQRRNEGGVSSAALEAVLTLAARRDREARQQHQAQSHTPSQRGRRQDGDDFRHGWHGVRANAVANGRSVQQSGQKPDRHRLAAADNRPALAAQAHQAQEQAASNGPASQQAKISELAVPHLTTE